MKSYRAWLQEGRAIRKGQKADIYAVDPSDPHHGIALFTEDQTEPLAPPEDLTDYRIVTADEYQQHRNTKSPPRVKVSFDPATSLVHVWVGSNAKAIKQLRGHGFMFNPTTYRWYAVRDSADKTIAGLQANGFEVVT